MVTCGECGGSGVIWGTATHVFDDDGDAQPVEPFEVTVECPCQTGDEVATVYVDP